MWSEFKKFLLRGNVVDLAVAVVVGAAFTGVVNALVRDIITPLLAAIGGKPDFARLNFTVHHSTFYYGDFLNALISFLIMASVIFFFVVQPINKLVQIANRRTRRAEEVEVAKSPEILLLEEIRDVLKKGRQAGVRKFGKPIGSDLRARVAELAKAVFEAAEPKREVRASEFAMEDQPDRVVAREVDLRSEGGRLRIAVTLPDARPPFEWVLEITSDVGESDYFKHYLVREQGDVVLAQRKVLTLLDAAEAEVVLHDLRAVQGWL